MFQAHPDPFGEVAARERRRRQQVRLGLVSFLVVITLGWFSGDPFAYALGVIAVVLCGLVASFVVPDEADLP